MMSWDIGADHFGADVTDQLGEVSSSSAPYAWDRLTADTKVRVTVGEHVLPFTSTAAQPAFETDISGAEWTVTPEVRAGELVLTAPDQAEEIAAPGQGRSTAVGTATVRVDSVAITNAGSGYTSVPSVTFATPPSGGTFPAGTASLGVSLVAITNGGSGYTSAPTVTFAAPASGTTAAGTATLANGVVAVTITNGGSGYTSAPTVSFSGSGTGATGTAAMSYGVGSVTITNGGSGYTSAPTVTFSPAPGGGTTATGIATLAQSGNDQHQNLYWARRALSGQQLVVQIVEE